MAQEGTSLSAVASNGTFTGAAVTPTTPFANASMVVTMSGYAGSGVVTVALQVSHDGTNWCRRASCSTAAARTSSTCAASPACSSARSSPAGPPA